MYGTAPAQGQVLGGKRPRLLGGSELAADPTPWDVQKSAGRGIDRHWQLGHVGCLSIEGLSLPTPPSPFPGGQRESLLPSAASDSTWEGRGEEGRERPRNLPDPPGQRDLAAAVIRDSNNP